MRTTFANAAYSLLSVTLLGGTIHPAVGQPMHICVQAPTGNLQAIPIDDACDDLPGNWSELEFADDDWTGAGTGAMRTEDAGDRVGIGDVDPQARLHIAYDETDPEAFVVEPTDGSGRSFQVTEDGEVVVGPEAGVNARFTINGVPEHEVFRARANGNTALFVAHDGQTGVRTSQPVAALHVSANAGEDPLRVETFGSNDALHVESGGNVGIGTSNPVRRLHVQGSGDLADVLVRDSVFARMRMVATDPDDDVTLTVQARGGANVQRAEIGTVSNHGLVLFANGTRRLVLRANGTVCIGNC